MLVLSSIGRWWVDLRKQENGDGAHHAFCTDDQNVANRSPVLNGRNDVNRAGAERHALLRTAARPLLILTKRARPDPEVQL